MAEIFILKLTVTVTIVVGLSIIAEKASPRIAGLLSGYPTGSAIALFFFGLEIGPDFAAQSAFYNMVGIAATLAFTFFYYKASQKYGMAGSALLSVAGYLIITWLLHFIEPNIYLAVGIPAAAILLFVFLFRRIKNVRVENTIPLSTNVLLIRALFAVSIILVITGVARLIGPAWAGLFSAFPTTILPLVLIIHYTYGKKHVHTIIKNVPAGIFSVVLYSLTISFAYPAYGVYWGTLAAFGVATVYLAAYQIVRKSGLFPRTAS
ncbi:MAG: hypothetical protein ABIG66_00030 [Candidatus Kerfeldbacteria bacterium]